MPLFFCDKEHNKTKGDTSQDFGQNLGKINV